MGKTLYLNLIRLYKFRPENIRESPIYFSVEIDQSNHDVFWFCVGIYGFNKVHIYHIEVERFD